MNFYLSLDENDIVRHVMAINYGLDDPSKILVDEFDLENQTGKKYNRDSGLLEFYSAPEPKIITKLAFRQLFTLEELSIMYVARSTDIIIEIFMDNLSIANEINLEDPDLLNGVGYMYQQEYITYDRMLEILEG